MASFWDTYAAVGYDALRVLLPYETLQQTVLHTAALVPEDRLLIAGCGTGNLEWLATNQHPALQVEAVDYSEAMLARAQAKCADRPVRYTRADLCQPLAFSDGAFTAAVMCNVLYALPDGPAALREMARVLQPGGRLVLCDRHPWSEVAPVWHAHLHALGSLPFGPRVARTLRTLAAVPPLVAVGIANNQIQRRYHTGGYRFYATDEITPLLASLGFVVEECQSVYADQCWLLRARRCSPSNHS